MVPVQGETLGKYEILIENIINSLHKYLLRVSMYWTQWIKQATLHKTQ